VAVEHGDQGRRSASLEKTRQEGKTTRNVKMGQNAQPGPEEGCKEKPFKNVCTNADAF
jgi:hypothetical protein